MEQFSLDKWLKDKSRKVVTRSGHNVRILCTDQRGNMPIVALVEFETLDGVQIFYSDGKNESHREYDLFFADKEEELTEFEQELRYWIGQSLCNYENNGCVSDNMSDSINIYLEAASKKLLDLARKELEANYYTKVLDDRMVLKSKLHATDLQTAYDMGKQDLLKDLPKWKKMPDDEPNDLIRMLATKKGTIIQNCEYYLDLDDLKTLPKEE